MSRDSDPNTVLFAERFAAVAHAGQVRKYTGRPYIEHPMRVAHAAVMHEAPPWVVAAAWMHDVIEDCGRTADDVLAATQSPGALSLVVELTNPSKKYPAASRADKKAMDRVHLAGVSYWAKVLKLLDRTDNINDMQACPDGKFIALYIAESRALAAVLVPPAALTEESITLTGLTAALLGSINNLEDHARAAGKLA